MTDSQHSAPKSALTTVTSTSDALADERVMIATEGLLGLDRKRKRSEDEFNESVNQSEPEIEIIDNHQGGSTARLERRQKQDSESEEDPFATDGEDVDGPGEDDEEEEEVEEPEEEEEEGVY